MSYLRLVVNVTLNNVHDHDFIMVPKHMWIYSDAIVYEFNCAIPAIVSAEQDARETCHINRKCGREREHQIEDGNSYRDNVDIIGLDRSGVKCSDLVKL